MDTRRMTVPVAQRVEPKPADVEHLAIETVRAWFNGGGGGRSADVTSERIGDWAATYGSAAGSTLIPSKIEEQLVENYSRKVLGIFG